MNYQVMLVDDDPGECEKMEIVFVLEGIRVKSANSGRECLEEFKKGFKGIVLLDLMMPEMDGWDVIREIGRQHYFEDNIICLYSAIKFPKEDCPEDLKDYVVVYIQKQLDASQMVSNVKEFLGTAKLSV